MPWDSGLHNLPARPPHSSPAVSGKIPHDGGVGGQETGSVWCGWKGPGIQGGGGWQLHLASAQFVLASRKALCTNYRSVLTMSLGANAIMTHQFKEKEIKVQSG